mgnify:CR=1 FL=1
MWDDHDYGPNNSAGTAPNQYGYVACQPEARTAYKNYVPHYPLAFEEEGKVISQSFNVGRVTYLLTDLRSEKDRPLFQGDCKNLRSEDCKKTKPGTNFGTEEHLKWFKDQLIEIEASKVKQPFLMALGIIRPHTPLVVPQKYYDMFPIEDVQVPILLQDDKDDTYLGLGSKKEPRGRKAFRTLTESYSTKELALRTYTQAYLASVAFADDMVGHAMDALNQSSFKDNTMVVLFSDHGYNTVSYTHLTLPTNREV